VTADGNFAGKRRLMNQSFIPSNKFVIKDGAMIVPSASFAAKPKKKDLVVEIDNRLLQQSDRGVARSHAQSISSLADGLSAVAAGALDS
jgi:hypothetical protein